MVDAYLRMYAAISPFLSEFGEYSGLVNCQRRDYTSERPRGALLTPENGSSTFFRISQPSTRFWWIGRLMGWDDAVGRAINENPVSTRDLEISVQGLRKTGKEQGLTYVVAIVDKVCNQWISLA